MMRRKIINRHSNKIELIINRLFKRIKETKLVRKLSDNKKSIGKKFDKWSRKGKFRREMYLKRELYMLMFPFLLLFAVFTILPVILSILLSFTNFNLLELPHYIGWDNYKRLFFDDDVFMISVKNTLILALITGPISYLLAFVIAWLINELPRKLRVLMTLIFYAPSISGNAFLIWTIIFSGDMYGYANAFLIKWGFIQDPIQWLVNPKYILAIIIIVQLWMSLGVSFLAFIAGLQGVDKSLYEQGAIDGIRNRWQELWYITLPSVKPALLFGAVMQITASFAIASVSTALVGFPSVDYAGQTIVIQLQDYSSNRFEMGYASAIASILFVTTLVVNLFVRKLLRRVGS